MAAPLSPTKLLKCPGCGASLPLGELKAGQKLRCGSCQKVLVVPGSKPKQRKPAEPPAPVGFNCKLCYTRLSAPVKYVGRKLKCPDCGRVNTIPPPPRPTAPKTPEAMFGEQYELWGVDEAPTNEDLIAQQPKFFEIHCRVCNTMMQAQESQVGSSLSCPDCGAANQVPFPPKMRRNPSLNLPSGEEYALDESAAPPERPTYVPYQVKQLEENQQREAKQQERIYVTRKLPKVPLLEGVVGMLYRGPLPAFVFVLAFALALECWFVANALANVEGMALMIVLVAYGTTAFFGLFILLGASAAWLAVLKETSEGNDKLYDPPGLMFLDWVGEGFFVAFSAAMAVAPGMLLWRFVSGLPSWAGPTATAASWTLLFPVFLLSQLQNGSPLEFFSPKIGGSLFKCLGPWLLFYAETIVVIGGTIAVVIGLQLLSPYLVPVSVTVVSLASFLYFRLLGRLAWWLAELLAETEEAEG